MMKLIVMIVLLFGILLTGILTSVYADHINKIQLDISNQSKNVLKEFVVPDNALVLAGVLPDGNSEIPVEQVIKELSLPEGYGVNYCE